MTTPVRSAREMRERAHDKLAWWYQHCKSGREDHEALYFLAAAMTDVAAIPISADERPMPTVEEAYEAFCRAANKQNVDYYSADIAGIRAVLALCGGETRERWGSWEEAAIEAAAASLPVAVDERVVEVGSLWVNVARAVLAKAPPDEP